MFTFTVQESVTIDRPIEELFDFLANCENDVQWCPSVKEIRQISENGSGKGTRYQMHHAPGGMPFNATVEVVAYERPPLFQWVMTDSGHTLHGAYELEQVNGRTRLTQISQVTLEGWLLAPIIGLAGRRAAKEEFQNLKRPLESQQVKNISPDRHASRILLL